MRKIFPLLIIIGLASYNSKLFSQKFGCDIGFEINQNKFRQYSPTVNVPYNNPHQPDLGIGAYANFRYSINKHFALQFSPLMSIYNTKSKLTDSYQINVYGLRITGKTEINRFNLTGGIEYNRLVKVFGFLNDRQTDWTFFAHRRNLFGTTISLGYKVLTDLSLNFRSTYFLKDFYSSGALDYDGNIVGPVEVTPFVLAIGLEYNLAKIINGKSQNQKKSKSKK